MWYEINQYILEGMSFFLYGIIKEINTKYIKIYFDLYILVIIITLFNKIVLFITNFGKGLIIIYIYINIKEKEWKLFSIGAYGAINAWTNIFFEI